MFKFIISFEENRLIKMVYVFRCDLVLLISFKTLLDQTSHCFSKYIHTASGTASLSDLKARGGQDFALGMS